MKLFYGSSNMALVLALSLLSALCGIHTASIPSNTDVLDKSDVTLEPPLDSMLGSMLDSMLESKIDTELDNDNLKQSVLAGVKKLLDSKLSSLARNGDRVGPDGIPQKRPLKLKNRSHSISSQKYGTKQETTSSEEDSLNSEFIKVLTDDHNQDPGEKALREAVDELLEENKNDDEVVSDDRTLDPGKNTDYNNHEKISKDAFDDITTPVMENSKIQKYRKGSKIKHSKKSNSVIEEHLSQISKKDDDGNKLKVTSDERLKSTLKDINGYALEHETDVDDLSASRKTNQVRNNMFLNRRSRYFKRKPYIINSQKPNNVDSFKISDNIKINGVNNVNQDETLLEMETPTSNHRDKSGNNDQINTLINSADKSFDFKRKLLKNNLKHNSKNYKALRSEDFNQIENNEDNYDDILDNLFKEDIDTEINENESQELMYHKEKPKRKLDKHRNSYRRNDRVKLEKNYNDKYERTSKPKPSTDLTDTSDLNASKENWLDNTFGKKETRQDIHHGIPLKLEKLDGENHKQAESYTRTSISKQNSNSEELNDITDDNSGEDNGIFKDIAYEDKEYDFQIKDFLLNNKRKPVKFQPDERKDDKRDQENDMFRNENDDVTYVGNINRTGKKKHVAKGILYTEGGSKKGYLSCRENNLETDESKIIRDLIESKDVKKSISFSLNFIAQ